MTKEDNILIEEHISAIEEIIKKYDHPSLMVLYEATPEEDAENVDKDDEDYGGFHLYGKVSNITAGIVMNCLDNDNLRGIIKMANDFILKFYK